MSILLKEDYEYPLPKMYPVRQIFDSDSLEDIKEALIRQLNKQEISDKIHPGDQVAVAVGSRGIKNLSLIVRTVIEAVRALNAVPYIVSAMGSHGNGTEEGQRAILEGYGITEEALGVEIVTTVDVKCLGKTESGKQVYFDRAALEADAIIPINRIKLHTDFVGDLQSGLCKMLVIGLGNQVGCSLVHEEAPENFSAAIEEAARLIIKRCNVVFGVGIIENAYDETFLAEVIPGGNLIRREKELVKIAREKMPVLIPKDIDVLIVQEIGKNISGAGYDPNILGKSSVLKEFTLPVPHIGRMVLLDVTPQSHGNAIGLGLFDVITRSVFEKLDYEAMYANAIACRCIEDCRIPLVAADEEEAIRVAVKCIRNVDKEALRIVKIKNTLELGRIEVSETVLRDIKEDPRIRAE